MLLEYKNGNLHWDGCDLDTVANAYGTPIHVCCRTEIVQSINIFRQSFDKADLNPGYFFSVKTNPIPEFLSILKKNGFGVETVTPWELWLVRHLGFMGEEIVVTGIDRNADYCMNVAESDPKMWVLESPGQVDYIDSVSSNFKNPVNIGLRICPALQSNFLNLTLSSGSSRSPYGFIPHSGELSKALEIISSNGKLNFAGFHFHIGSGIMDSRPYEKALSVMLEVVESARKAGCETRFVNIGGGFGTGSAPVLNLWELVRIFLGYHKPDRTSSQLNLIGDVASAITKFLTAASDQGTAIENILIEPGWSVSQSTQMIILTVQNVIERPGNRYFIFCDAGAMSLSTMLHVEDHRIMPLKEPYGEKVCYKILGNMPSSLDIVSPSAYLPEMQPGDRLAVLDTGAYFYSFNNNFAGPRPGVVIIENGNARELHRSESFENLLRCEIKSLGADVGTKDNQGLGNGRQCNF